MSEEMVEQPTVSNTKTYAGFWMRFWAFLIDLVVIASIEGIILIPFQFIEDGMSMDVGFWTATGILGSIVFYLYFLLMTKFFNQTLGKMILGLRVVREDRGALTWSDLIFREVVGRFIHQVFVITVILYAMVGFTDQKQGLHDMFASTRVVFDK